MKQMRSERRIIDAILNLGGTLPFELIQEPAVVLRLLRRRLKMTQKQLAERSGLLQSNIASFESGKRTPSFALLQKLFKAMGYSVAFLPISDESADEKIERQSRKVAKKNVKHVMDTMALEDQIPSNQVIKEMINEEQERLLQTRPSRIWNENSAR